VKKPKFFSDIKAVPMEKEREKQIDNLIGVFTDPIICYRGGGGAYIPEHLKSEVTIQRLLSVKKYADKKLELTDEEFLDDIDTATDIETMIYLMTVSLSEPLNHKWTEIYLYLTKNYIMSKKKEIPNFLKEVKELSPYLLRDLNDLKRWIKRKQVRHRKKIKRA